MAFFVAGLVCGMAIVERNWFNLSVCQVCGDRTKGVVRWPTDRDRLCPQCVKDTLEYREVCD